MGHKKSRSLLVGLGATVAAFGAAATMWAATAPTARADDFTDIIAAVNGDLAQGQSDFTTAFSDFSSNHVPAGLTAFFNGVDADLWSTSTNLEVGTVEALLGEPITGSISVGFSPPTDFSGAVAIAETLFSSGEADFTAGATALSSGMYADAVIDEALGSLLAFDIPSQLLLVGGVEALGL
jgi:hypothetical protein